MKQVSKYVFGAIVGALSFAGLSASDKADNAKDDAPIVADASELQDKTEKFNPVIVELFLSQSCRACPPAAKILKELSDRPDVMALSWHVDYWDKVPAKNKGAWADPFADAEFTSRQRTYNKRLRGRATVFTPQAVVNGETSTVGSKEQKLLNRIEGVSREETPSYLATLTDSAGGKKVLINAGEVAHDLLRIKYYPSVSTYIERGANAGQTFEEVNIVAGFDVLVESVTGQYEVDLSGGSSVHTALATLEVDQTDKTTPTNRPQSADGCVLLLQESGQGRITSTMPC